MSCEKFVIIILVHNEQIFSDKLIINNIGEMAEWTKAHDSKSCFVVRQTGVQIPLSPFTIV